MHGTGWQMGHNSRQYPFRTRGVSILPTRIDSCVRHRLFPAVLKSTFSAKTTRSTFQFFGKYWWLTSSRLKDVLNLRSGVFFQGKGRGKEREEKLRLIHLFYKPPTAPTINKLNCLLAVSVNIEIENGRSRNACDKRLVFWCFLVHSNDDKCILFPLNARFQAFSYRIFPETSRNLSDERLKHLHVNLIQRDSDAKATRQLLTLKSREKKTANHNRANLGVLFLNQSGKKVRICPFNMRSVKGMFQALFPSGYKRKGEGLIAG